MQVHECVVFLLPKQKLTIVMGVGRDRTHQCLAYFTHLAWDYFLISRHMVHETSHRLLQLGVLCTIKPSRSVNITEPQTSGMQV